MINFPTNSTDPTCPVSSDSFWDNDGNLNDNTHIHDNRYYTKDEIDNKLDHILDTNKPIQLLNAGIGLDFFEFDGTKEVTINLDFEESHLASYIGISQKPARSDHYHSELINGTGLKTFVYNGSKNSSIMIDFDFNGSSSKVSRADHVHKILSTGIGLLPNSYDSSANTIFNVNFGLEIGNSFGTSNIVSRVDHYHKILTAGNGLVFAQYTGVSDIDFSLSYGGHGSDWGIDVSVARSDHTHSKLYTDKSEYEENAIISIENRNNSLVFINTKNQLTGSLIVDYATISNKLETERLISLEGAMIGSALFDGSQDITIDIKSSTLTESEETINSIKKIVGQWLTTQTNKYISIDYDINQNLNIQNLASDKLLEPIKFILSGDISAAYSFDGSDKNMNIPLILSTDGIFKVKDIVSQMFDYSNLDDKYIKVQYDSENQKMVFKNEDLFKTTKHNIPTEDKIYNLGQSDYRFNTVFSDIIDCNIVKCNQIDVDFVENSKWAEGLTFVSGDGRTVLLPADLVCFTKHLHLNSDIQPDIIFSKKGLITTDIRFEYQLYEGSYEFEYSYDILLNSFPGTEEHINALNDYPKEFIFNIFNANWNETNFDYKFKWTANFENDIYIKESFDIMTLSAEGDLWIKKDLTVDGNLIIKGTSFIVNSEEVAITDNYLIINSSETGDSVTRGEAGLIIERGTSENYKIVFKELTKDLEIGIESNLKKVSTIERNIENNSLLLWNSINNIIDKTSIVFDNIQDSLKFTKNDNILKFKDKFLYINDKKIIDDILLAQLIYNKTEIDNFFEGTSVYNKKIIDWGNVSNKPTVFLPVTHDHNNLYEPFKLHAVQVTINANSFITYNITDIFGKFIDPSRILIDVKVNDTLTTGIISAYSLSHYSIENNLIKIFNNYNSNLVFRISIIGFNK